MMRWKIDCLPSVTIIVMVTMLQFSGLTTIHAQDPHFSQYYAAPLYLNPALTGLEKDILFGINYRTQWRSIEFPYTTGQFSMILPIYKKGITFKHIGGVGITLYNDIAGENGGLKASGINLSGSYNISLPYDKRQTISLGVQLGFVQKKLDLGNLQWGSQYNPFIGFDNTIDPGIGEITEQTIFPVVNAGWMWYFNPDKDKFRKSGFRAFLGMSVANLNQPDESLYQDGSSKLPMLYKLHGGVDFKITRGLKLTPNLLLMSQNKVRQVNAGAYLTIDVNNNPYARKTNTVEILVGTWKRMDDSMIFTTGLNTKNVTVGVSYDLNSSSLRYQTRGRGAMELSIAYRIIKGKGIRRLSTPLI